MRFSKQQLNLKQKAKSSIAEYFRKKQLTKVNLQKNVSKIMKIVIKEQLKLINLVIMFMTKKTQQKACLLQKLSNNMG